MVGEQGAQDAGVRDENQPFVAGGLGGGKTGARPRENVAAGFAAARWRKACRIGGPGVQGGARDVVPAATFPGTEIHFQKPRFEAHLRVQGGGEQPAAARRAAPEWPLPEIGGQLPGDARRGGGRRRGQIEIEPPVTAPGRFVRPGMADQI